MPTTATKLLRERIVLIFDFDDTLGPNTDKSYLEHLGLSYADFRARAQERQDDLWQGQLAKADLMREYSQPPDSPVNRQSMEAFADRLPLFPGADRVVDYLKAYVREQDDAITPYFVLLTSGFKTLPEHSLIGRQFDRIYGGEYHFGEEGQILGARRIISHVDKVHYIKLLAQGLDMDRPSDLENTYLSYNPRDNFVPLAQVIYVGDGASDMSAFQEVETGGGVAIAIDPRTGGEWDGYERMSPDRRVHNIAPADYRENSVLITSLKLALSLMVHRIKLLRLGDGK